jgi:hypothetical protein
MTFPGLVRANNLNDIVDQEKAWDNLGDGIATGDISIATPSLDLNFAANKSLVDDISGNNLITFSRASTGTFVGSDGLLQTAASGVPRFDHNPTTGASLGLLVEEARTNVRLYSNDLANTTAWDARMTKVPNSIISPDGTLNGWKISDNSTGTNRYIGHADTGGTGTVFSMYVKRDPVSTTGIVYISQSSITVTPLLGTFNLDTGTATASNGATVFMHSAGNGWYRIGTYLAAGQQGILGLSIIGGDPSRSVYVYGGQLEAGSFPTSYIPTVASTVTRAADVASITGANFSSWYRQDEGTMFYNWRSLNPANQFIVLSLTTTGITSTATQNEAHRIRIDSNNTMTYGSFGSSSTTITFGSNSYAGNTPYKTSFAYKLNNFYFARNGTGALSSSGSPPLTIDKLTLMGARDSGTASGAITRLTYWPTRLYDVTLRYITQPSIDTINLYSFSYSVVGKDILALNSVRNTSTRDFIFIKGLLSSVQPRLNTASQNTSSGVLLDSFAMPKLAPTTSGNYFFSTDLALSGVTTRINGTNALSIATSPFSGSTTTAPLLFRELRPQANWRITEPMSSGTIASPSLAIPFETNDFVLFMKAGQN